MFSKRLTEPVLPFAVWKKLNSVGEFQKIR